MSKKQKPDRIEKNGRYSLRVNYMIRKQIEKDFGSVQGFVDHYILKKYNKVHGRLK